jgi:selenocysteine lyase/cysteine desulfurase
MKIASIREQFPVTAEYAYFNHAAIAPLPRRTAEAMRVHLVDAMRHGAHAYGRSVEEHEGLRRATAAMLNCNASEIAITKNTSEGLCAIANGLDWRPGDVVVGLDSDFPANYVPWRELQSRRGVRFRSLQLRHGVLELEDLDRACKGARVAALSHVHFLTGFRWDLRAAGEICRRRGCALVVDAVQGMGAFPISVKDAGVHALSASGHKWLLGPEGCGVLYIDSDWMPAIEPVEFGWTSLQGFEDYRSDGALQPGARRFECGTLNSVGCAGLRASIEALNESGARATSSAIHALAERLLEGALSKGYEAAAPRRRGNGSGIVSLRKRGLASADIVAGLSRNRVSASDRMGWVRAAPHFYNTVEEIDRLLERLP